MRVGGVVQSREVFMQACEDGRVNPCIKAIPVVMVGGMVNLQELCRLVGAEELRQEICRLADAMVW